MSNVGCEWEGGGRGLRSGRVSVDVSWEGPYRFADWPVEAVPAVAAGV